MKSYVSFPAFSFSHLHRSAIAIATDYWLEDQGVGVQVPVGQEFLLLHVIQIGSGVHPTSYPMGAGDSFSGGKAAGA
jgi:hypothetical protein